MPRWTKNSHWDDFTLNQMACGNIIDATGDGPPAILIVNDKEYYKAKTVEDSLDTMRDENMDNAESIVKAIKEKKIWDML